VDDDPVIRLMAGQALEAIGFLVSEAEGGQEALAEIERAPYDLVLLDVEMPGLDGFETCVALRQNSASRQIPVLIATGLTESEIIDRAFESGATDFIKKPLDWQILQHRIRFLLRASGAFDQLRSTLTNLRDSERRLASAQRLAQIGNWEWIPGEAEMLWSDQVYRILQISPGAGATYEAFLGHLQPEDRVVVEKAMEAAVREAKAWSLEHRIFTAAGEQRIVHQQAEVVRGDSGEAERIAGTIQDITERRHAEKQIRYLAHYDSLTALPNRRMLNEHLRRSVASARAGNRKLAILHLDLDRFKRVNDTLGPSAGDDLIKCVAGSLLHCVRASDYVGRSGTEESFTVSRLGGDEFTVLIEGISAAEDAAHVARRILEVLRRPFSVNGRELVMSASIGIAVYPNDGPDTDTLLRNADAAMYHAKARGGNIYQFFSESMNKKAMHNLELENALRGALERDELVLHYQPQLCVATDRILAVEALVRWSSPEYGMVSPGEFIPLAEETGLIGTLGEWVLRTACFQLRAWQQAELPPLRLAVNVSSHQVMKPGLVELVEQALRDSELAPDCLELEITESAILGDDPCAVETLTELKRRGIRLALDDFGTGYSSLSHLVRFPIDALKIDRSFVKGLGSEGEASAIVAAIVAMAYRLKLIVIAEGVETAEQETLLRTEGCDLLQGFRIARPTDADALTSLLRERGAR
jgi:diguanylate cyclase (GGDEF)-like protein